MSVQSHPFSLRSVMNRVAQKVVSGGLAAGLLLGLFVPAGPLRSRAADRFWEAAALACVAVVLVAFWQVAVHPVPLLAD